MNPVCTGSDLDKDRLSAAAQLGGLGSGCVGPATVADVGLASVSLGPVTAAGIWPADSGVRPVAASVWTTVSGVRPTAGNCVWLATATGYSIGLAMATGQAGFGLATAVDQAGSGVGPMVALASASCLPVAGKPQLELPAHRKVGPAGSAGLHPGKTQR